MNSAKYIEIFKNGQKEGIRDVTVKRKLQTVRKFLSYLEDAQTDDLQNIDRKNVYEFVNSLVTDLKPSAGFSLLSGNSLISCMNRGCRLFDGIPTVSNDHY